MNKQFRKNLEKKMANVTITLRTLETVLGSTQTVSRKFDISDLTDKEIMAMYSSWNWGLKKDYIYPTDRNENASLYWEV